MNRILACMAAALIAVSAFAQTSKIPQRLELAQIEINDGAVEIEVFKMPVGDENHYYLSAGHVGIGDEVFQVNIDPVSELFVYLGNTLAEAMEALEQMKALYKTEIGTSIQMQGCLAVAWPREEKFEPVTISFVKPFISKVLVFSVERGMYLNAASVTKSEFNSLLTGMKIYKKIHPKEQ